MIANPVPSVSVRYAANGSSTKANEFGMRPMQERAFEKRGEQYLPISSLPGLRPLRRRPPRSKPGA